MRKIPAIAIASLFVAAALAAGPGVVIASTPEEPQPGDLPDAFARHDLMAMGFTEWIVGFHELPRDHSQYGGHPVIRVLDRIDAFVVKAVEPATLMAHALLDERVRYIEYDDPLYAELFYTPNDPLHTNAALWGTHRIGAEAAWDKTLGSTAVKIAVVDSGLNFGHEEFAGQDRVLSGWNYHGNNNNAADTSACSFHGTHVSGTLGATIDNGVGFAGISQSTILPLKIFGPSFPFGCGAASTSNIANALMDAGDQGAHISQNSWGGGGSSSTLNNAIAYAHGLGTTHVAAAGNSGPCSDCVSQPWRDNPNIVNIVSASNSNDQFAVQFAGSSQGSSEGPQVTVIAPGDFIGSSTSGTNDYHAFAGTSMAAPHVSGALALFIAANGNVGFSALREALTSTAEDLGETTNRQGAGLLRVDVMLDAGPGDPDPAGPTASFTFDCTELACAFDGSGSTAGDAPIASYEWDFGDGNSGSGETTSHEYAASGTYTVTLTVTDTAGLSDADSQNVEVSDADPPPPGDDVMHVHDIFFSEGNGPPPQRTVFFHVDVRDENENALQGVEVCIDMLRHSDGATNDGCGTTGSGGTVTIAWENAGRGTYTACATSLTLAGYEWDPDGDHASGGSCHTGNSRG